MVYVTQSGISMSGMMFGWKDQICQVDMEDGKLLMLHLKRRVEVFNEKLSRLILCDFLYKSLVLVTLDSDKTRIYMSIKFQVTIIMQVIIELLIAVIF